MYSEPFSFISLLVLSLVIVLFNFLFTSNLIYVLNYETMLCFTGFAEWR